MSYLGVDLHTNSFTVCYRSCQGKQRIATFGIRGIDQFRKTLRKPDTVAVEATGNTAWFVEQIRERVAKVVVVDPHQFEVIRKSVKKTDKHDARTLAYFLSKDMLPEARMKSKENAQLHSLAGTRDKLVKQRTALVNKIYNVLNRHGLTWKKETLTTEKGLKSIMAFDWEPIVRVELEVLIEQVRSLSKSIRRLDEEISDKGRNLKGHKNLTSIKGIGERSATVLLSVIGDVNDFADENKLAAYFGIVPRVSCLFNDFDPSSSGTVSIKQLTDRVVVTWEQIYQFGSSGCSTFQIEMYFDGRIQLAWLEVSVPDGIVGLSDGQGPSSFEETDLSAITQCEW
jgi:transposase